MILDLSAVVNADGKKFDFKGQIDFSARSEQGVSFLTPVGICGRVSNIGGSIELFVDAEMKLGFSCDRCLDDIVQDFRCNFGEVLKKEDVKGQDEKDFDAVYFKGNNIELDEIVFNNIMILIPLKHLCKEDCRGLCPGCGKNLNFGDCGCDTRLTDPRFDILDKFFK